MPTKTPSTTTEEQPPFKDIAEIGEILPDSSGRQVIKVRIVEKTADGSRTIDVRKFILPTKEKKADGSDKYSGPTGAGIGLAPDQIDELLDLLTEAKAEFEKIGTSKKAAKVAKKKAASK